MKLNIKELTEALKKARLSKGALDISNKILFDHEDGKLLLRSYNGSCYSEVKTGIAFSGSSVLVSERIFDISKFKDEVELKFTDKNLLISQNNLKMRIQTESKELFPSHYEDVGASFIEIARVNIDSFQRSIQKCSVGISKSDNPRFQLASMNFIFSKENGELKLWSMNTSQLIEIKVPGNVLVDTAFLVSKNFVTLFNNLDGNEVIISENEKQVRFQTDATVLIISKTLGKFPNLLKLQDIEFPVAFVLPEIKDDLSIASMSLPEDCRLRIDAADSKLVLKCRAKISEFESEYLIAPDFSIKFDIDGKILANSLDVLGDNITMHTGHETAKPVKLTSEIGSIVISKLVPKGIL